MSDFPKRRARRPRVQKAPVTTPEAIEERQPRGARRKLETRTRLLEAALTLMAEKGMERVTINEITEAADVGFGSFYNHFESKEAIYTALVEWAFEEFGDALDNIASGLSDPAEVVAVSVRHTLMRARREPVWARLLIREGFSARALGIGLGQRLLRDSERGIAAKRFVVTDPLMCLLSVTGTVLAGIATQLNFVGSSRPTIGGQEESGSREEKFPERAAIAVLQALGLKRAEAERIAQRPLPMGGPAVGAG